MLTDSALLTHRLVSPNQGFVFTQLETEPHLFILLVNLDTQLGRRAVTVLESKFAIHERLYFVQVPKVLGSEDVYYLKKLGVTILPELREYRDGRLHGSWKGLDQLALL